MIASVELSSDLRETLASTNGFLIAVIDFKDDAKFPFSCAEDGT